MATASSSTSAAGGKRRRGLWLAVGVVLALVAILAAAAGYYFLLRPTPDSRPLVSIRSPDQGQRVAVGEAMTLHAVAQGDDPIVRVEFWADGELQEAERSSLPEGTSPLPLVTTWVPPTPGAHTLMARAFDARGGRAHASISVEAVAEADGDGDGVADEADTCPDEPGWASTGGCPDADGDMVADAEDGCPEEAGPRESGGCPAPADGDRDGDGTPDEADLCPDEPGMPTLEGCPMPEDRDGDLVTDADDACPDVPGSPALDGCPDGDGDGIVDGEDACPEEVGPPPGGCPAPADGDRDGDTFPDAEDECPDEPGVPSAAGCPDADGDGVRDSEDACPEEPGPVESDGCPAPGAGEDGDGDGVPDAEDASPDEWGPGESGGCPDGDGDGVCDDIDRCPDAAGPPERAGCPETGAGDRDGDGVTDDVDRCPDEPGLPEHEGCPPPGEGGDDDGDGIPDDEEAPTMPLGPGGVFAPGPEGRVPVAVEFQVLSYRVSDDYDGVYCYPSLAGGEAERYVLHPLGGRQWDIPAELASRRLTVPLGDPVEVRVEGGSDTVFLVPEGGWGTYYDLGDVIASHPSSDWDGHVITARSSGGDGGRWFEVQYRLCSGSCERATFPPPTLSLFHYGGDAQLVWLWDGERSDIDGFWVYVDGSRAFRVPAGTSSQNVNYYRPLCGSEGREFAITAYRGDRESPLSNTVGWRSTPCPRQVRVTFEGITTYDLGDDEWWAHGESVGPIYGNFWAQGSTDERLSFFAVDYGEWAWERDRGFRLRHGRYYLVQDIFDQIWTWIVGSMSSPYRAPDRDDVIVELGPYEDLTFGGTIWDSDSGNPDDTLFDGRLTLRAGEVVPGRYVIRDRNIQLSVLVDVIVGPEAGDKPDLTISDVTQHEESGQLRIHVFNNAADLVDRDISVNLVRISSNEQILLETWEHVSIPCGGSRILQLADPPLDPYDLRVIVDPDNQIEEMDEGNNIRETPVVMRVEFLSATAGHCAENSCSIFDCDSEFVFHVWAGYGPSQDEVSWVGYHVRFPRSGELVSCGHDICRRSESPDSAWRMEGESRYTFEFEMPADQNLYVMADGAEQDWATDDDSLGYILRQYGPTQNWGARADEYQANSGGGHPCDDTFCTPCSSGFSADWRITRVH